MMKKKDLSYILLLFVSLNNFAVADVYDDLAKATQGTVSKMTKEEFRYQTNDGKHRYGFLLNASPILMQSVHIVPNEKLKISFPIDAYTFGNFVIELTGDNTNTTAMILTSPSGQVIQPAQGSGDPKLPVWVELASNHIAFIVPNPKDGDWTLHITTQNNSKIDGDLIVRAQSSINIQTARFIYLGGRPGHQGYFPLTGALKAGSKQLFEFAINNAKPKSLELYLVDKQGRELKKLNGSSFFEDKEQITADIEIPVVPFRIRLNGIDKKGKAFQRFVDKIFTLEVSKKNL
ncbi:MAG: hypothetical protein JNM39_16900 [Bdellovibrionaceae bacterium]|nr:hypothetical protein [Pseudobdellovibrionaceae bacterium]